MSSSTCSPPTLTDVNLTVDDQYAQAGQLQMDLAAAALACDQTRILTFQWSYSESEHLFSFLNNISGNHHAISHDFSASGVNYDAYNAIQTWYAQQVAYFLAKLDSYQEGDRTLLDNTLVLWATEIGESTQHDLTMMPYVLAGSAGGKIKTGARARLQLGSAATTIKCWCPWLNSWAPTTSRPSATRPARPDRSRI